MQGDEKLTGEQSLEIIQQMIHQAKNTYHEKGIGPILWGTVITFCSLMTFAQIHYHFKLPFDIWWLTFVAILPQIIIVNKEKKQRKVRTHMDTVMDYVWTCFGFSIFILIFINGNVLYNLAPITQHYKEHVGPVLGFRNFQTSYFLLLYGIPTIITGGITNLKPMLYGGILCWVLAVVTVYTNAEMDMLLTALAATCAWLIPGIILWRKMKMHKAC
ncbi:MAG: hypothetical protein ACOYKE_07420 [Ferruginibacter sp.]